MYLIKNRTHYANDKGSITQSYTRPEQLADFAREFGHEVCGMCDYGNLSGIINFLAACKHKKAGDTSKEKAGVKPVIACEMPLVSYDTIFIPKNTAGWYDLIKLTAIYREDGSISLAKFFAYSENMIICMDESVSEDEDLCLCLRQQKNLDDIFIQVDINNSIKSGFRDESDFPFRPISVGESRYLRKTDIEDFKIILASQYNKRFNEVTIEKDYCLESYHNINDDYEHNLKSIIDKIEEYDILSKPKLPRFTDGDEVELLRELCRVGWREKIKPFISKEKWPEYADRVKTELEVFEGANLSGYFLIVQDFVKFCKGNKILIGPARGSAGGCLVSYLLDITSVDPMPYNLMFSRFYNKGRNTGDHIEYPDIDIDFPVRYRETVINYIRQRYGEERVAHVITFGKMSAKNTIKDVLRAYNVMDVKSIDNITKKLPQDESINDKMNEGNYTSIIQYTLENEPDRLVEYCVLKDGKYMGELGQYFEQAVRIEGTFKNTSKHAAGIVIGHTKLSDVYPMMRDKKNKDEFIVAYEMNDLGKAGGMKFDILGLAALDKLLLFNAYLREGNISWQI